MDNKTPVCTFAIFFFAIPFCDMDHVFYEMMGHGWGCYKALAVCQGVADVIFTCGLFNVTGLWVSRYVYGCCLFAGLHTAEQLRVPGIRVPVAMTAVTTAGSF